MKKKIVALCMLALLMLSLTGCMQISYHITLNQDGTADATYEMYISNEYMSMMAGEENVDPLAENKASAQNAGFEIEEIKTEEKTGFKATAKNLELNIDEMINGVGMGGTTTSDVQVKKGFLYNVYSIKTSIDTTDIIGTDPESQAMLPLLNSAVDLKILFTAPSEIITEGGTLSTTQPNTCEYKIELGKNNEISLSYKMLNMTNLLLVIGLAVVLLAIVLFLVIKQIKKKNEQSIDDFLFSDFTTKDADNVSESIADLPELPAEEPIPTAFEEETPALNDEEEQKD